MRTPRIILAIVLCAALSGCATVSPNQKWPILPEHPRPTIPVVSRVPLLEAIGELEPGEQREKIRALAIGVTDELIAAWQDFTFWGDRMAAAIKEYNEQAEEHNKKVK